MAETAPPRRPIQRALTQDPHVKRERPASLEAAVGHAVREARRRLDMTLADLAAATGLSIGMLSKIERGGTSPSLHTLQRLSRQLGLPMTAFFQGYEENRPAVFVKAGDGLAIERRGTRAGHQYSLLGFADGHPGEVTVEPYLITLTAQSDTFPTFQHEGYEFLYMLEGVVGYRHGDNLYEMHPGDSLFFDAAAPHGPEVLHVLPARYLSVIAYATPR